MRFLPSLEFLKSAMSFLEARCSPKRERGASEVRTENTEFTEKFLSVFSVRHPQLVATTFLKRSKVRRTPDFRIANGNVGCARVLFDLRERRDTAAG